MTPDLPTDRIAIFGATGTTGRHLVEQALRAGHSVTVLARDPAKAPAHWRTHERVRIVQGDAKDPKAVREALRGARGVLNAVGHRKDSPKDLLETTARHILDGMREERITRLVHLTGAGVRFPEDRPTLLHRAIGGLLARLQPELLADSLRAVELVKTSGVEWTLPRATRIVDKPPKGEPYVGPVSGSAKPMVSAETLARWMVQELDARSHVRRAPAVTNP